MRSILWIPWYAKNWKSTHQLVVSNMREKKDFYLYRDTDRMREHLSIRRIWWEGEISLVNQVCLIWECKKSILCVPWYIKRMSKHLSVRCVWHEGEVFFLCTLIHRKKYTMMVVVNYFMTRINKLWPWSCLDCHLVHENSSIHANPAEMNVRNNMAPPTKMPWIHP